MSMAISGNHTMGQNTVKEAEGSDLFKGAVGIAVGLLLITFVTVELAMIFKGILAAAGVVVGSYGIKQVAKYLKADKIYRDFVPKWDNKHSIYDRFAEEVNSWYETGKTPEDGDGDIAYFLRLQKNRLQKKGLRMEKKIVPSKGTGYGTGRRSRTSLWYTTDMLYEQVERNLSFHDASQEIFQENSEMTMYEMVVHAPDPAKADQIQVTCPNCGAVNAALKLEEGCPYCGTRFQIRDLFPRVVNFFFIKSQSIARNKKVFTQSMALSMAGVFLYTFISNLINNFRSLPAMLFNSEMMALVGGGLLGYLIGDARLLAALFDRGGMKHISLWKWVSSKRKITNAMLRYDKNFAFDKFEGQLVALIRMAVMTEGPENLACYGAGTREDSFGDILEMTYTNGICLNKVKLEGNTMHLSIRTWWINYYEKNGKIRRSGDRIDTTFVKNITNQEKPGFSITSVSCKSCGGSFDAVRQKTCPYCGNEYHMENESWMIEKMHLIQ